MARGDEGFNQDAQKVTEEGYVPYGKPFIREKFETSDGYTRLQYPPCICQAFVKYNKIITK